MLIPNIERVIIKPILIDELKSSGIVTAGQLTAGENLLYGEIVHEGTTKFKKGQEVFYSEYSAASLLDAKALLDGSMTFSEAQKQGHVIVAEDDIMAYYDVRKVSKIIKKDKS